MLFGNRFFNAVEQIEFRVVAAALELGTKYAFDAMRGEALRRLSHCYPRDLEAVSDEDKPHCSHHGHSVKTGCSIIWCEDSMTDPILAFRLARRLGLDDLIPMALYYCVKEADLSEILSSLSDQDGSFSKSSTQDLVAFIHAHEYLSIRQVDIYENFSTYKPSPHCANKDLHENFEGPCHKAKDSCASHTLFHHVFRRRDVFYPMDSYVEDMGGEYCEPCSLYYKETIFKQQKEAWAYLRAKFGSSSVSVMFNLSPPLWTPFLLYYQYLGRTARTGRGRRRHDSITPSGAIALSPCLHAPLPLCFKHG